MGGEFDGVGDERECGQDVGELGFRQAVEVGDQAVQFRAEFGTLDIEITLTEKISNAFFLTGKVSVGGQVTVRFEFACAAADAVGSSKTD